jgi:hypothetical protein
MQCLAADLNGKRPLLDVERFLFTLVNVRRCTSARGDGHLREKKSPPVCLPVIRNRI